MILAADIGGTKVNLAFFEVNAHGLTASVSASYHSRDYAGLQEIVRDFLNAHRLTAEYACFGIAGPVRQGRAEMTNLQWTVDAGELARAFGLKEVWLINDLEANAHGIGGLAPADFVQLNRGTESAAGNLAVISAGTGLGEAGLVWDGRRHLVVASEGGHADFAPRTALDIELLRYLQSRFHQVTWEHVLSGPGSFHIYEFLRDTGRGQEPAWLAEEFRELDPPAAVTRAALAGKCALCSQTLDLFVYYYACEAANLALKMLAMGGIYLGGGIAPRIITRLQDGAFMKAFIGEGRMRDLLASVPVHVIMNDRTALIGAARYAATQSGKLV